MLNIPADQLRKEKWSSLLAWHAEATRLAGKQLPIMQITQGDE